MPDDSLPVSLFGDTEIVETPDAYLARQAERIRGLGRVAAHSIIEMGRTLIEVKHELDHGEFKAWIDREFGWSDQQARRFMHVADAFGGKSNNLLDLGAGDIQVSALYALAAPSAPPAARDAALEAAERGEVITKAAADRMIAEAKEAAIAEAERRMLPLAGKVADLEAERVAATKRADELEAALEEAMGVAEAARQDGKAQAEAAARVTITKLEGMLAEERAAQDRRDAVEAEAAKAAAKAFPEIAESLAAGRITPVQAVAEASARLKQAEATAARRLEEQRSAMNNINRVVIALRTHANNHTAAAKGYIDDWNPALLPPGVTIDGDMLRGCASVLIAIASHIDPDPKPKGGKKS